MSNSYNDRRARLVLSAQSGDNVAEYRALVDSSGFYSTADEHYFVSLVEATPFSVFATGGGGTPAAWPSTIYPDLAQRSIAIVVDFPQTGSYNNTIQGETRVVGYLHRDNSSPAYELRWKFAMAQNAPFKISPDVVMKKRIGVRFVFDNDAESDVTMEKRIALYVTASGGSITNTTFVGPTLMFSITKSL